MERMLGAEMTSHLGYEDGKDAPPDQTNRRNPRQPCSKVAQGEFFGARGKGPSTMPRLIAEPARWRFLHQHF